MSPEIFLNAPPELIPLPFNVKGSALIEVVISKAAPLTTAVPEDVAPSAAALVALKIPELATVAPV